MRIWSIYDIDRAGGGMAWDSCDGPSLLPPSWSCVNRENGHAHLVWGLSAPVLVESPEARRAPIRFLVAIEAAMRARLQADSGYNGVLMKNPAHPLWRTFRGPRMTYELHELGEYVDLAKHVPKQGVQFEAIGLGRNCLLFEWMRRWAYTAVHAARTGKVSVTKWHASVLQHGLERNGDFPDPLGFQEVRHIAKSVAKWVWTRYEQGHADSFRARQAQRGHKGGLASGLARAAASEDKRSSARLMAAQGMKQAQIARELDVHRNTVIAWLKSAQ